MGSDKDKSLIPAAAERRHRAEKLLQEKMPDVHPPRSIEETERLVHELEVHRIELEMQNAELRQARDKAETMLKNYSDLYDFAPVGYVTLDRSGVIRRVNLAGACLIGGVRSQMIGHNFGHFVAAPDRPLFTTFLNAVLTCEIKETCEVALSKGGKQPVIVQIEGMATVPGEEFRLALIDITQRKQMEEQALRLASFPQLNPNPVLEVDRSGAVTFANPATHTTLEKFGISGENVTVFIPPDLNDIMKNWNGKDDVTLHREIKLKERVFAETISFTSRFGVARIYSHDITERKRMEDALHGSEQRIRLKLENILSPEGSVETMDLGDIIDVQALQSLMDDFYKLVPMPTAILDLKGTVLVGKGWQDICTLFHRVHPETRGNCLESDLQLTTGIAPGEFKLYKCKNNMWDVATPIMVGDSHVGYLFSGQFFLDDEPLDYELFKSQARRYGFNEDEYIAALERVPRLSRESLATGMEYLIKFTDIISKLSYSNIKLARSLAERDALTTLLCESEERHQLATSVAKEAIWDLNLITGTVQWNRAYTEMLGRPQEAAAHDQWWCERIHPDDRKRVTSSFAKALTRGKDSWVCEYRMRTPDNSYAYLVDRAIIVRNAEGVPLRAVGAKLNVTEQKLAEDALLQSEERYHMLFSTLIEGFCIIEVQFDADEHPIDYRFLEINPAFEEQTGLRDAQGKLMRELAPEHEAHWFEMYGKVALTGESTRFENEAKELNRWYDVSAYRIGGADSRKVAILFNDITARKQAEGALLESHGMMEQRVAERTEELAATVETLRGEIAERERMAANLQRLNRLYAVLGETNQTIIRARDRDSLFYDLCRIAVQQGGFLLSWVGLMDMESSLVRNVAAYGAIGYLEDIHVSAKEELAGTGPTGMSIREGTYHVCNDFLNDPCTQTWHERGRTYGIKASASVAVKEEGWIIGALTLYAGEKDFFDCQQVELLVQLGADVSFALDNMAREARRHKAEQALQQETFERLQTVEALRENEQMLLQQNRLAAMGEMINNIAHQWRQPLNVLALLVQQIQLFYDSGSLSKEELDSCVNKSMGSINHMSQTIDDFRNFFKPDKKQVLFKIQEVVAKTVALVEESFKHQQITIDCHASANPVLRGFPNEYCQVLLNILTNARDALQERSSGSAKVTITVSTEGDKAVVTIADNAGGIPEDLVDRIFEPYFTTKGPDKGTGVGLFMSKTIIEKNMNGRLTVLNTTEGAEFRIEI